jgi:23S rRNA pseudouridine1911/1915/1917 synthase
MEETGTSLEVGAEEAGLRLDVFVARRGVGLTRSQVEKLTKLGKVRVGGKLARPGQHVEAGERVEVVLPEPQEGRSLLPEPAPLDILFEDDQLLVLNKPQGLVVHPGVGHLAGTLVNALLARYPALKVGSGRHRPGIVHRLDRDTSGLMVVAKTELAFAELGRQIRERELQRRYLALVWGGISEDRAIIEVPIGRHRRDRMRMAAVPVPEADRSVRPAHTEVRVLERLGRTTLVEARLGTGRTHQIRVHLAHIGHPVVGDRAYGLRKAKQEKAGLDAETLALVAALPGQALHAHALSFRHPVTGQQVSFSVSPPHPMAELLTHLRRTAAAGL